MPFLHSDDLDAQVRAWRDVSPPAVLEERIAARALSREHVPLVRPTARRPRWRPVAAFAAAAVLLVAALLWPGAPGRPTVALANVERAVQQVNIVTATESHTDYLGDGTPLHTDVSQCWMRRTLPAIASVPLPALSWPQNLVRLNITRQLLQDGRGQFIHEIAPAQGNVTMNIDYDIDAGARLTPDKMRGMLDNLMHGGRTVPDGFTLVTLARSETIPFEGRSVLRIVRQVSYRNKPEDTLCTETYWIDPATLRPLRIESRAVTAQTRKPYYTDVLTGFRYDVLPPAGVFDWSPPKGARVNVIYRTPFGLYKTDRLFPSWKGSASIPPLPAK